MRIGYFCYALSGTGPRQRARDVMNAVAARTDHEVIVFTNQPEEVTESATTVFVSLKDPLSYFPKLWTTFADCDVVHVPVNIYQVAFVRAGYRGPLVAGIGPGLQTSPHHMALAKVLDIDTKIVTHEYDTRWDDAGFDTAICTATIDRDRFYPFSEADRQASRRRLGIDGENAVLLYVGELSDAQGASLVDEMARRYVTEDTTVVVAGDGPLRNRIVANDRIRYEGYVANDELPSYYNVADVTLGPRKIDNTSNVGLESIACGTPFVTTADGHIRSLFERDRTYVWATRDAESLWQTTCELLSDERYYEEQAARGLRAIDERPVTLERALRTHLDVYARLVD